MFAALIRLAAAAPSTFGGCSMCDAELFFLEPLLGNPALLLVDNAHRFIRDMADVVSEQSGFDLLEYLQKEEGASQKHFALISDKGQHWPTKPGGCRCHWDKAFGISKAHALPAMAIACGTAPAES